MSIRYSTLRTGCQSTIKSRQGGYTLIQMAIALLVIGIMSAAFIQVYTLYEQTQKLLTTQDNVDASVNKIQLYRQTNGFYPCPAPMNVDRTNADYGTILSSAAITAAGVGDCVNGVCIEQSPRTDLATPPRVRVGAIPFRDIQLDENTTFDGYGSRMWYAVTEDLCARATFDELKGGIGIYNENDRSVTGKEGSAAYIVISPGENQVGSYTKYATVKKPCADSGDTANCRDVATSPQTDTMSRYLIRSVTNATEATTYDDVIQYFAAAVNPMWRRTAPTSEDIIDMTNENVGIGTSSPADLLTVSQSTVNTDDTPVDPDPMVSGDETYPDLGVMTTTDDVSDTNESGALRASDNIQADTYCDKAGGNCFKATDIAGDASTSGEGLKCPAGQHAVGIEADTVNKRAKMACVDDIGVFCRPGRVLTGFTSTGGGLRPNCTTITTYESCATAPPNECGTPVGIGPSAHGFTSGTLGPFGACRTLRYKCWDGSWGAFGQTGSCVDTPSTSHPLCSGGSPGPSCYTGTYTVNSTACGGSTDDWDTVCPSKCQACATSNTVPCGSSMTGPGITTTTNYTCSPDGRSHVVASTTTTGSCTCALKTKNVYQACPAGFTRKSPPSSPPTSETGSTNSWPASDPSKGKVGTTTVDLATCTESGPSSFDSSNCVCDTTDKYTGKLAAVPSCKVAKSGSRVVNGTPYEYKYDVFKTTINAGTCTAGLETKESSAEFEDVSMYWRQQAGAPVDTGKASTDGYPLVSEGCTCSSQSGTTSLCAKASGSKYDFYWCKCGN